MIFRKHTQEQPQTGSPLGTGGQIALYALLYLAFFAATYLPILLKSGFILGGDGYNMYFPTLVNFRDTMRDFFGSVRAGHPQLELINFNFEFGRDNLTILANYVQQWPYFIFTVFMPDAWLPGYLTASAFLLDFLAGIAFLAMCRHFGRCSLWDSVMALAFAFSGNFIGNSLYNPQFMVMYLCFPLMVIGVDRVLAKKGWRLLAFCVFWVSLGSFTFLIYTLPLLAVFALLRVWFTQRDHFFKNLISAFLRCLPVLLCGALLACFMTLPTVYMVLHSVRSVNTGVDLLHLLIPEAARMNSIFLETGSCIDPLFIAVPGVLAAMLVLPEHRELKGYLIAMCVMLSVPFFDYALNGFQYPLIRWGFVPALLFAYAGSVGAEYLTKITRRHALLLAFAVLVYGVAFSSNYFLHYYGGDYCSAFLLCWLILAAIPPVRRLFSRLLDRCAKLWRGFLTGLSAKTGGAKHFAALIGMVFGITAVLAGVLLLVLLPDYILHLHLVITAGLTLIFLAAAVLRPHWRRAASVVTAILLTVSAAVVFRISDTGTEYTPITEAPLQRAMREVPIEQNTFGRTVNENFSDLKAIADAAAQEEQEQESGGETIDMNNSGGIVSYNFGRQTNQAFVFSPDNALNSNFSLVYRCPDTSTFDNLADGDLLEFFERIGQNTDYLGITGFPSLSGKQILHTLFGISTVGTNGDCSNRFGLTTLTENTEQKFFVSHYDYALPVGVTYDRYMSDAEYDALSSAVLPFAMLHYATVGDGRTPASDGTVMDLEQYRCDISVEKTFTKTMTTGVDVYSHELTVHSDVTNCFLFLTFDGAYCKMPESVNDKGLRVTDDLGHTYSFALINNDGQWPWLRDPDRYSFDLGYRTEALHTLSFEPAMEYDELRLYAIPAEVLTAGYAARTAETLENVQFSTNTLEGDITVSGEKLLSVSIPHNDGWRVFVDGTEQPVEHVNRLFIGTMLTAGTHHVRFVYRTPWLTAGLICVCCGVLLWIVLAVLSRRARKQREAAPEQAAAS